jgi:hypothetical protein
VYIVADRGGTALQLWCKGTPDGGEICEREGGGAAVPSPVEQTRIVAIDIDDAFEFSRSIKDAARAIRYKPGTGAYGPSPPPERNYCRLNLVAVTTGALSVHQTIPCDADWQAEATRVRRYVESLFAR